MENSESPTPGFATPDEAFEIAFNAAPVGMAIASLRSPDRRTITHANQALCDMLGYRTDELTSLSFADITHPDHLERDTHAAQEMRDGVRDVYVTEKRYLRSDGSTVWAWLHSSLVGNGQGDRVGVLAHIVDLTERRAADAELERRRRWLEGLAEVTNAALLGQRSTRILSLTCRHAMSLVGATKAFATHVDEATGIARPIAFADTAMREQIVGRLAVTDTMRAALNGPTFVSGDVVNDPRIDVRDRRTVRGTDDTRSTMVLGIEPENGILLHVESPAVDAFDEDDISVVESFAEQAAAAVKLRSSLDTDLRLAVLEQRERLAGELQDTVIQRVFAAGMGLQSIVPLIADHGAADRVVAIVDELDGTIAELRATVFRLSSAMPDPLRDGIDSTILDVTERLGFEPKVDLKGDTTAVPLDVSDAVLDGLAAALDNIVVHASATEVDVLLDATGPLLQLVVADNGVGVDANALQGTGVDRIRASVADVGGAVEWTRGPAGGTTVEWSLPQN